jgi:Flp pilus assembly protein TadG
MPLLLAMVVGILDFGQAYNLKQKLNNAAREGARFAIEESCADCTQAAPATTQAIENSIVDYLTNAGVCFVDVHFASTMPRNHCEFHD